MTFLESADLVLRYLQVLLTWPVAVVVLGLVVLHRYHDPLSSFLRRVTEAGGEKFRLKAADPDRQKEVTSYVAKEIESKVVTLSASATEAEIEQYIAQNPKSVLQEFYKVMNSYRYERAYSVIFGTQIELLEHLAAKGDVGESYINLVRFYEEFQRRSGNKTAQMADYVKFLEISQFLEYFGEGHGMKARITPHGVNFLSYIKTTYGEFYKGKAS